MRREIYGKINSYQTVILSIFLVMIGSLFIAIYKHYSPTENIDLILSVLKELGAILISTGIVALLWELIAKRSFFEEIMEKIKLAEQVRNAGLKTITNGSYREIDWPNLFKNVKDLDLCFAYARTWRHINTLYLQDLASKPDVHIRVMIPDPENPDIMRELSQRFEITPEDLKSRVNEAIDELNSVFHNCKAKYALWYLTTTPLFSVYRFDNTMIIALHKHGKNRGQIPVFQVERDGDLYKFAERELNTILDKNNRLAKLITDV